MQVVSSDGVGDDEDFPHHCGQGDLSRAPIGLDDTVVEVAHCRGMTDCRSGGVEKGASHDGSSVTGLCAAASCSALVGLGGEADEGGDLLSAETAELGQVGNEGRGDNAADAAHRAERSGEAFKLSLSAAMIADRLSRTRGSAARSARQHSACRASTSCLRRAASARKRSSTGIASGKSPRASASARYWAISIASIRSVLARKPRAFRKARMALGWNFT